MSSGTNGQSLREQLGAKPDPDFEVKLPPGWERRSADAADRDRFEAALKHRAMQAHRPDLFAKLRSMLHESYAGMQREGVLAYYAATDDTENTFWIPGSLVATVRRPEAGGTLKDLVTQAIRDHGATPLFGDKRFVRFEREKQLQLDGSTIVQTSVIYLTPMPGSRQTRALQLTAGFGREVGVPADDPKVKAYKRTFDLIVSTLRWLPPAS